MKQRIIFLLLIPISILLSNCKSTQKEAYVKSAPFDESLMELPKLNVGTQGEYISYCGFNLSFNKDWLIPNWVAYELTREETQGMSSRKKQHFQPDPNLDKCAENTDYSHSGYSRGHLAPAGDMKWDSCAMTNCFYLTNICPQDKEMNAGCWQTLEEKCRVWARGSAGSLLIVCGPIVKDTEKRIGRNGVVVPDGFFKAVLQKREIGYVGIGFLFPNKESHLPFSYYAVSIDDVERVTRFDLFHNLPDSIEESVESKFKYEDWGLREPETSIIEDANFLRTNPHK